MSSSSCIPNNMLDDLSEVDWNMLELEEVEEVEFDEGKRKA